MTKELFPKGIVNSPIAVLRSNIFDWQTTIPVDDSHKFPDPPNLATIGIGTKAETIKYEGKAGNDLTEVTRGFQGIPQSWDEGTRIARNFTEYDFRAIIDNLSQLLEDTSRIDDETDDLDERLTEHKEGTAAVGYPSHVQPGENTYTDEYGYLHAIVPELPEHMMIEHDNEWHERVFITPEETLDLIDARIYELVPSAGPLIIPPLEEDPEDPEVGQIWLRTDLLES